MLNWKVEKFVSNFIDFLELYKNHFNNMRIIHFPPINHVVYTSEMTLILFFIYKIKIWSNRTNVSSTAYKTQKIPLINAWMF